MKRPHQIHTAIRPIAYAVFGTWLSAMLIACSPSTDSLQGRASYLQRIALPEDAVFDVVLQDISRADAKAEVIAHSQLNPAGQTPFAFTLNYDTSAILPGRRYAVRATIKQQNKLLFTTDRVYPVLDGDDAPLELLLVPIHSNSKNTKTHAANNLPSLPASFAGELPGASSAILWHVDLLPDNRYQLRTSYVGRDEPNSFDDIGRWNYDPEHNRLVLRGGREAPVFLMPIDNGSALRKLDMQGEPIESAHNDRLNRLDTYSPIEAQLMLTGMFRYMADAANITLCVNDQRLPVAMEADYKTLEQAYSEAKQQPGQAIFVKLDGRLAQRPSMEENLPPQTTLIVDRFIDLQPEQSCTKVQQ